MNTTVGLTELDVLLAKARNIGFKLHRFHGEILAGVFHYAECADVFVLSGAEHAYAYRVPTGVDTDVFAPARVYWWYAACPVWTLRALLTLPEPDLIPAPPGGAWWRGISPHPCRDTLGDEEVTLVARPPHTAT